MFSLACQESKTAKVYGGGATERELRSIAKPVDQSFSQADGSDVAVMGTIGKVCSKGCWFYVLGDESMVYVDLSVKDLIIPTSSTQQKVWIKGVIRGSGADRALEASMVLIEP